jgi:hypothetical protein
VGAGVARTRFVATMSLSLLVSFEEFCFHAAGMNRCCSNHGVFTSFLSWCRTWDPTSDVGEPSWEDGVVERVVSGEERQCRIHSSVDLWRARQHSNLSCDSLISISTLNNHNGQVDAR